MYFPGNFAQVLKILFIEHLWVTMSAYCKDFVTLQILVQKLQQIFIIYFFLSFTASAQYYERV